MKKADDISVVGVDLGGTKVLSGVVKHEEIVRQQKVLVPNGGDENAVLDVLCHSIDEVMDSSVRGIGIGVPSVVDVEKGIVYDVQNIPSWKEVHLKEILENKYNLPVYLNNDANCFALGEKYFGKGKPYTNFVGLIVGTGMAAGLIINHRIFHGANCGAGEFGMIPYLDHYFEYYSSGQFFDHVYNTSGQEAFYLASQGHPDGLKMFQEFGIHLGNAINAILYAFDPDMIILGGSVSKAFQYYEKSLWSQIRKFVYRKTVENLKIEVSTKPDIALLGAAALVYDAQLNQNHGLFSTAGLK